MSQNQFLELFKYISAIQKEMQEGFEQMARGEDIDRLYTLIDSLHGKADIDDTERVALSVEVERHEDWIGQASSKLGVRYHPGA